MLSTSVGLVVLGLVSLAVLPVPRVRRWLLSAFARLVQGMTLAAVGACGTFFVAPDAAPDWVAAALVGPVDDALGLTLSASSGLPWLALGVLAVGLAVPVLVLVELAVGVADQAALARSVRADVRSAAAWFDRRLAALGYPAEPFPFATEADHGREAFRTAGRTPDEPAPLVLDLVRGR